MPPPKICLLWQVFILMHFFKFDNMQDESILLSNCSFIILFNLLNSFLQTDGDDNATTSEQVSELI